jgi:tyrosinase
MKRRQFLSRGVALISTGLASDATAQPLPIQDFIRLYFCRDLPKVRRNAHPLAATHPIIDAYRRAVEHMQSLPAADPHSWAYQAAIHGTSLAPSSWPASAPFATCEHFTKFFLSWHRMYLHFFERIVRAIANDGDFALPYWGYDTPTQRTLPPAFASPTFNGAPNVLFDATRTGGNPLPATATNTATALAKAAFLGSSAVGFQASLEGTPHGAVHVQVSGNMALFETAALDPIFWLHHCNIDRLWEVWLAQGGGQTNPTTDADWMDRPFTFVDECRRFVTLTGADVLHTANQLGYQYDSPRSCVPLLWLANEIRIVSAAKPRINMLLARNVEVRDRLTLIEPERELEVSRLRQFVDPEAVIENVRAGVRYVLAFEDLAAERPLGTYLEVYLGAIDPTDAAAANQLYVGNIDFFGALPEERTMMARMGHTRSVELDITEQIVNALGKGMLDPDNLAVTLAPGGSRERLAKPSRINPEAKARFGAVELRIVEPE